MNYLPRNKHVLVRVQKQQEKTTPGGLLIPGTTSGQSIIVEVEDVGENAIKVAPGNKYILSNQAKPVQVEPDLWIVLQRDLIAGVV